MQQTENVQAARQIGFASVAEAVKRKATLQAYVKETIEPEKRGTKVELKNTEAFTMPEEFRSALEDMPALKAAFYKLTPGRQRGYLLHFSAPKQAKNPCGKD